MYNFYPSILDSFNNYLRCSEIYQKYWGGSENPSKTEEEYEKECFQGLIDKINRVPFESEAADKGTAYNELIDLILDSNTTSNISVNEVKENENTIGYNVTYKDITYFFSYENCLELKEYLKYGLSQEFVEGILDTDKGQVRLYGYLDYRLPDKVVDLKTTSQYSAFKYRNNMQHLVYPYCLHQSGIELDTFEYVIVHFAGKNEKIYVETYCYKHEEVMEKLKSLCSHFIDFLETYKNLITNKKIFGLK